MASITALYWMLAATGGVGAGLLGKSLHNAGRMKNIEEKVKGLSINSEVRKIVDSEINRK